MASSVSQFPKVARTETPEAPTPAFPLLVGILIGVSVLLIFAINRGIGLGIFG